MSPLEQMLAAVNARGGATTDVLADDLGVHPDAALGLLELLRDTMQVTFVKGVWRPWKQVPSDDASPAHDVLRAIAALPAQGGIVTPVAQATPLRSKRPDRGVVLSTAPRS